MKIQIDKIDSLPKHSLSIKTIKRALSILPSHMTSTFNYVHVSNQLPHKSRFDRPVILSELSKRLNICDRGITENQIVEQIYVELAQRSSQNIHAHYANRLATEQYAKSLELIKPYLDEFKNQHDETE